MKIANYTSMSLCKSLHTHWFHHCTWHMHMIMYTENVFAYEYAYTGANTHVHEYAHAHLQMPIPLFIHWNWNRQSNQQSTHGGTQAVLPSERFELGPEGPSRFALGPRAPSKPPLGLAAPSSSLVTSMPSLGLLACACSWREVLRYNDE